jgi:hypothetical protein
LRSGLAVLKRRAKGEIFEVGMRNAEGGSNGWEAGKLDDRGQKKEVGSGNLEGGIKKRSAKSIAQSVQKVENKRITTEGHGATRKDSVYKFVVSV